MNPSMQRGVGSHLACLADTRIKKVLWIIWFAVFAYLISFLLWIKDLTT